MTAPPIPYFGAKGQLAPAIVGLLPPHQHYVEPYGGSLAVLLAKPRSTIETVNDLDLALVTFWRVLRDRPRELALACELTPHSRVEHTQASLPVPFTHADRDLEVARRLWVQLCQGRAGKRRTTGWRFRVDPDNGLINLDVFRERFAEAAGRLRGVQVECLPALDLIARYGQSPRVLLYVDPPYPRETRSYSPSYLHEMPDPVDHATLADALRAVPAAVVVSSYRSELYERLYEGWYREELPTQTAMGGVGSPRCEVLWANRPLGDRVQGALWDPWGDDDREAAS